MQNKIRTHACKKWANMLCKGVLCITHCSHKTARENISSANESNTGQTTKAAVSLCAQFAHVTSLIPNSNYQELVCRPNKVSWITITIPHRCCVQLRLSRDSVRSRASSSVLVLQWNENHISSCIQLTWM